MTVAMENKEANKVIAEIFFSTNLVDTCLDRGPCTFRLLRGENTS